MFYRKSIFDEIMKDFETLFENVEPTYYKVGPNGFYFSYTTNSTTGETDDLTNLKSELQQAVDTQDFEKAVELRDKIKSLEENSEKIQKLKSKLQKCIEKEEFEKAIELRDEIKKLQS
jgi:protein-arginine kinase activator protein McsA